MHTRREGETSVMTTYKSDIACDVALRWRVVESSRPAGHWPDCKFVPLKARMYASSNAATDRYQTGHAPLERTEKEQRGISAGVRNVNESPGWCACRTKRHTPWHPMPPDVSAIYNMPGFRAEAAVVNRYCAIADIHPTSRDPDTRPPHLRQYARGILPKHPLVKYNTGTWGGPGVPVLNGIIAPTLDGSKAMWLLYDGSGTNLSQECGLTAPVRQIVTAFRRYLIEKSPLAAALTRAREVLQSGLDADDVKLYLQIEIDAPPNAAAAQREPREIALVCRRPGEIQLIPGVVARCRYRSLLPARTTKNWLGDDDKYTEALLFPLLFPGLRADGWHEAYVAATGKHISLSEYTRSALLQESRLQAAGRLAQVWAIVQYARVQAGLERFWRSPQVQGPIKRYHTLAGRQYPRDKVFLPASCPGSPQYQAHSLQRALGLIQKFGNPSLFLTMTQNPHSLRNPEDLMEACRVFNLQVRSLIALLKDTRRLWPHLYDADHPFNRPDSTKRRLHPRRAFDDDLAQPPARDGTYPPKQRFPFLAKGPLNMTRYMYAIEFQKRGLPHVHLLAWFDLPKEGPPHCFWDTIISGRMPDPPKPGEAQGKEHEAQQRLHRIVSTHMWHALEKPTKGHGWQCKSACQVPERDRHGRPDPDGATRCKACFPQEAARETTVDDRGRYHMRRRPGADQWVVEYSPELLMIFDCHINVMPCYNAIAICYLVAYVTKGLDMGGVNIMDGNDQIAGWRNCRYVSATEAVWRMCGYDLLTMEPAVVALRVPTLPRGFYAAAAMADGMPEFAESQVHRQLLADLDAAAEGVDGFIGLTTIQADARAEARVMEERRRICDEEGDADVPDWNVNVAENDDVWLYLRRPPEARKLRITEFYERYREPAKEDIRRGKDLLASAGDCRRVWVRRVQNSVVAAVGVPLPHTDSYFLRKYLLEGVVENEMEKAQSFRDLLGDYNCFRDKCIALGLFRPEDPDEDEFTAAFDEWIARYGPTLRADQVRHCMVLYTNLTMIASIFRNHWRRTLEPRDQTGDEAAQTELALRRLYEAYCRHKGCGEPWTRETGLPMPTVVDVALDTSPEAILRAQEDQFPPELASEQAAAALGTLRADQRAIHDDVMAWLRRPQPPSDPTVPAQAEIQFKWLFAEGGAGKTYVVNSILQSVRALGKVAIPTATTGIAATLYTGGKTVHTAFNLGVNFDPKKVAVSRKSEKGRLLQLASLIVIDEITMASRTLLEAVLAGLDAMKDADDPRCIVLAVGDPRQLPTVTKGTARQFNMADTLIGNSFLAFSGFTAENVHQLHGNSRIVDQEYLTFVRSVGLGTRDASRGVEVPLPASCTPVRNRGPHTQWVAPPPDVKVTYTRSMDDDIAFLWPDGVRGADVAGVARRACICLTNADVRAANEYIVQQAFAAEDMHEMHSHDALNQDALLHTVDMNHKTQAHLSQSLHTYNAAGAPPARLSLAVGMVVTCLRNYDHAFPMMNGTRAVICGIGARIVTVCKPEDWSASGPDPERCLSIPRINFTIEVDTKTGLTMTRRQFPLAPAYAITVHKAQGQTLERIVVNATQATWEHGQLYTALSRVRGRNNIAFHVPPDWNSAESSGRAPPMGCVTSRQFLRMAGLLDAAAEVDVQGVIAPRDRWIQNRCTPLSFKMWHCPPIPGASAPPPPANAAAAAADPQWPPWSSPPAGAPDGGSSGPTAAPGAGAAAPGVQIAAFLRRPPDAVTIIANTGAGDCFFKALAQAAQGSESQHAMLRARTCDRMVRDRRIFEPGVVGAEGRPFNDYVAHMRQLGVSAGDPEMAAFVREYPEKKITVLRPAGANVEHLATVQGREWLSEADTIILWHTVAHYEWVRVTP